MSWLFINIIWHLYMTYKVYTCMYIYTHTHTHTHIHTHIHTYKTHTYIHIYIYIYTHYTYIDTHKYTYIYTYIHIYIKRKPRRKSWFCIKILNETDLIDVSSTKPTWGSMWLPLINGFIKAVSVVKFFISLGTSSQIFGPKWESYSVPCKTVRTCRE